jgi:tRNA(Arg) A34 adenosine deaminase TadA
MSEIMIRCPESGSEISTGIDCDSATFRFLPFLVSHAHCPICGKAHIWSEIRRVVE